MNRLVRTTVYGLGSGVCLALGVYASLGVLQAVILFADERSVSNLRFWTPLALLFVCVGVWLGQRALRQSLQGAARSRLGRGQDDGHRN